MAQVVEIYGSEAIALWQCIGCGAMGNAEECQGNCDFKRFFVVGAERHADLLEFFLNLSACNARLRQFAQEIIAETAEAGRFERSLPHWRARAKDLLALAPVEAAPQIVPSDERAEIWLCARCGQVEALRECLGVCIRRAGDFVFSSDHDGVAARVEGLQAETRALIVLARQIAWSAPKAGQTEVMRVAFRRKALEIEGDAGLRLDRG
jgi:hypothetical protein